MLTYNSIGSVEFEELQAKPIVLTPKELIPPVVPVPKAGTEKPELVSSNESLLVLTNKHPVSLTFNALNPEGEADWHRPIQILFCDPWG